MDRMQQMQGCVLVVDDHAAARESMAAVLRDAGLSVRTAASAAEALTSLQQSRSDVVVSDLRMPGMSGLELVQQIRSRNMDVQILLVTAHASVDTAVQAMREGAFDYLEKPFNADALLSSVYNALAHHQLLHEKNADVVGDTGDDFTMIGNSAAMQEVRRRIALVAQTDETVLICGESGTGKELVAKALHAAGNRADGPLVSLNCPVLSAQLLESELFGHMKGAFTGADADRVGRFETAQHGTLLLDEVTEIDLALQAKLLRVLQERVFERVGSNEPIAADARVVATTNRDPHEAIADGKLRHDLYYRLAVVPIHVPPLRERRDDIPLIAKHFVESASRRLGKPIVEMTPDAQGVMQSHHWPGNVRELQNLVTRACVLNTSGRIDAADLQPWVDAPSPSASPYDDTALPVGTRLDEMERRLIEATLQHHDGHREKTAHALGIAVRTLSSKLRKYGYAPRQNTPAGRGPNCDPKVLTSGAPPDNALCQTTRR